MSRTIFCTFLQREVDDQDFQLYPGELGKRIYNEISKEAWALWQHKQTMLINEKELSMTNPERRKLLEQRMMQSLFEGEDAHIEGYTPLKKQQGPCDPLKTNTTRTPGMMKKYSVLALIAPLLVSCSSPNKKGTKYNEAWVKDTNGSDILMSQFVHNIEDIWGYNEVLLAGPEDYVKYTDQYQARSHTNFDAGTITIETTAGTDSCGRSRQAIIKVLLMGDDPNSTDLYSDVDDIQISKEPFLHGQVVDNVGASIRWEWRAARYADYLLQTRLKNCNNDLHMIYSIAINLVPNRLDKRVHKYLGIVRQASRKYGVDESLILVIMQTESLFDPHTVSHTDAMGLMQVVQHSAGEDAFRSQDKSGLPSRSCLFDSANNIDTGTAYPAILNNVYPAGIGNPTSRCYAVITACNGGAGSTLRVFSSDRARTADIINSMTPGDVYQTLTTRYPSAESRWCPYEVNTAQKSYRRKQPPFLTGSDIALDPSFLQDILRNIFSIFCGS